MKSVEELRNQLVVDISSRKYLVLLNVEMMKISVFHMLLHNDLKQLNMGGGLGVCNSLLF